MSRLLYVPPYKHDGLLVLRYASKTSSVTISGHDQVLTILTMVMGMHRTQISCVDIAMCPDATAVLEFAKDWLFNKGCHSREVSYLMRATQNLIGTIPVLTIAKHPDIRFQPVTELSSEVTSVGSPMAMFVCTYHNRSSGHFETARVDIAQIIRLRESNEAHDADI
jgi:hypothetical protein